MSQNHLFTEKMIAPCGLDCSLCKAALKKENPCPGCNGPDKTNRCFAGNAVGSFCVKNVSIIAINTAMNARIIPVRT